MTRKIMFRNHLHALCTALILLFVTGAAIAAQAESADSRNAEARTSEERTSEERASEEESTQTSDRRCLGINQIRRIEIIDDSTIHFHMRGGQHDYINHLPHRCPGLKSRGTFMHSTSTNNYCDLDTISVIDTHLGMRLASCPLGRFEAVERRDATRESEQ